MFHLCHHGGFAHILKGIRLCYCVNMITGDDEVPSAQILHFFTQNIFQVYESDFVFYPAGLVHKVSALHV